MSLDSIITVTIHRTTVTPTAVGFGVPMIAAYFPTSIFPQRVKSYTALTDMETDGFKSTDPAYIAAADCWAQNPSPPTIKIGRRDTGPVQQIAVVPDTPVTGDVHAITVVGYVDGAFAARALPAVTDTHSLTVTDTEVDAEDIVDLFVTAFATPLSDFSVAKNGTGATATLEIDADNTTMSGMLFGVTYTVNGDARGVNDTTPDPTTVATDLNAIQLYDPDWYGFCLDSNSSAEILAAADWADSTKNKLFVCQTQDIEVASETEAGETTPSVATTLKTNTRAETMLFYHRNNREYICAAMLGRALPTDAGSITWAYKQLSSVTSQALTSSEITNMSGTFDSPGGKNVNFLSTIAGVAVTRFGTCSSGEYTDIERGAAWLAQRIQERVYALLIQQEKVSYTDGGINSVKSEILAQLQIGVDRGFIAADPEPTCTVPRASEVAASLKAARTLEDVTFRATLAGAVHRVAIVGRLTL